MIFESFKQRKLENLEANAIDKFEKTVKVKKVNVDDLNNDKTSNAGFNYSGYTLLGKIEIPSIGFSSVILKDNTYRAMDLGVVLSYGVMPNELGGTVLSGHNYRGQTNFMYGIKNLSAGDKIYLTDSSGRQVTYTVYETIRYYDPNNTDIYKKYSGYHVTLITCESGGQSRIIVKASAD
jgi:LPXTG-site transpeptidase (sortase) family protein